MTDVYVIGSSLPALAAALELAEVGLRVRVALDRPVPDGAAADPEPGHGPAPVGERDHDGALEAFLVHVSAPLAPGDPAHPGTEPVATPPNPVQLRSAKGGWTRQPLPAVIGIPAVPMDAESLAILGGAGATRAALDRIKPVLTIGKAHELGALVRSRLGRAALERLVDPLVRDRFGAAPDEVEVAVAAPGLNEALTRAGSLSGAALALAERDVARETRVAPRDGWAELRAHLIARLELFGAELVPHLPTDAQPVAAGWRITEADGHRLQVRAVVADPETPVPDAVAAACALVAPEAWRAVAEVEVSDPGLADPDLATLQTVDLPSGARWSVRVERDSEARWWARLAGPQMVDPGRLRGEVVEGAERTELSASVDRVIAAIGVTAVAGARITLRPAPHCSLERRDVETAAREALREAEPSLVIVGAALFAGDLADAIADARMVSTGLRRRLTGITE